MSIRVIPQVSSLEEFVPKPRPKYWLERDELDQLLALNREWIIPEPRGVSLRIQEYIDLHDVQLRPLLVRFFDKLNVRIVGRDDFFRHFYSCIDEFLLVTRTMDRSTVVYLMGGREFGKSNMWLLLVFWQYASRRFPFRVRVLPEGYIDRVNPKENDLVVFVDDCSYSGQQIKLQLRRNVKQFIVCPYVSSMARTMFDATKERGFDVTIISRVVPFSTRDATDLGMRCNGRFYSLFSIFDISEDTPQVTWIFEHKIADSMSVPQPLFSNTPTLSLKGDVSFVFGDERGSFHIEKAPSQLHFSLVFPCEIDKERPRKPCYGASYKTHKYLVTDVLLQRILQIFSQIHPEVDVHLIK